MCEIRKQVFFFFLHFGAQQEYYIVGKENEIYWCVSPANCTFCLDTAAAAGHFTGGTHVWYLFSHPAGEMSLYTLALLRANLLFLGRRSNFSTQTTRQIRRAFSVCVCVCDHFSHTVFSLSFTHCIYTSPPTSFIHSTG